VSVWKKYGKFIAEVVIAAIVALIAFMQDDRVDAAEWILVIIAAARTVAVLGAGNLPAGVWAYTKSIVSAFIAGAGLLVAFVSDGGVITGSEWLQIIVMVAGTLGVVVAPAPRVYDALSVARISGDRPGPAV
jgi:hypothetical protein